MKRILFLVFLTFLMSCKEDKAPNNIVETRTKITPKQSIFKISLEGVFSKDDYILFFYENEEGKGFDTANKLKKGFKGSKEKQTVTLTLPEDENFYNFSLHISDKIGQEITIDKLTITDNYDTIEIKKDSLFYYIHPNDYIEMHEDGSFNLITKKKNGKRLYNPIFKAKKKLKNKLKYI